MYRFVFLAFLIGVAPVATVQAAGPLTDGNWQLTVQNSAAFESVQCILKVVTTEGRPSVTVLATPPRGNVTVKVAVKDVKVAGQEVAITFDSGVSFVGTKGKDSKEFVGNFGMEGPFTPARLVPTEKETLTQQDSVIRHQVPELLTKAQQLGSRPLLLRFQAQRETDADKKKELLNQAMEAQKEANDKLPEMYREIASKNPDTPAAAEAALVLIRSGARFKVTPQEAPNLVKQVAETGGTLRPSVYPMDGPSGRPVP